MAELFYNKKENTYYLVCDKTEVSVYCSACKKPIDVGNFIFIHKSYSKKEYVKEFLCPKCIKKHKLRIYDEFMGATVSTFVPDNSKIIVDFPPFLKASTSIFDAALSNKRVTSDTSDTTIIDHTKLAGKH